MVRCVSVHVPAEKRDEIITLMLGTEHATRVRVFECYGKKECCIQFVCVDKHLSGVLLWLQQSRLGKDFGSIDIFALQSTIPGLAKKKAKDYKRKYNYADRKTVREIEDCVDEGSHLTFDFIVLIVVASMIAAVGLLSDSPVIVVASMLISPLMGPIMAIAYGSAVRNMDLVKLGVRNEAWGIFLCLTMGIICGAISSLFYAPLGPHNLTVLTKNRPLNSFEMESRGEWIALFTGFFLAAPSGIGVAIGVTNAAVNALVGVAISAALLPPLVNSGIGITLGTIYYCAQLEHFGQDLHFFKVGGISLLLFIINFLVIWLFAYITFRIKGVTRTGREFAPSIDSPINGNFRVPNESFDLAPIGPGPGMDVV